MPFLSDTLFALQQASLHTWLAIQDGTGGPPPKPGGLMQFLPLIMVGALAWFLLIAPERKRQKARLAMLAAIQKHDKVVTSGGLIGVVTKVEDAEVGVRIADGVTVHVQRGSIASVLSEDKGNAPENH